jgi:antitoxin component YwqK of YwqJK toxin-antitoxin module
MKQLIFLSILSLFVSCSNEDKASETEKKEQNNLATETLTEFKDGVYTEYYPGKKEVKIRGYKNAQDKREGKWVYYSKNGEELSITYFKNGLREGHTIVKRPNGSLNYVGEYREDKMIGIWKFYDEKGNVKREKDYNQGK